MNTAPHRRPLPPSCRKADVDYGRLAEEVENLVALRRPGTSLARLSRRPRPARSSWAIEDLILGLGDGTTVNLVWKDLGREAPGSAARAVKPAHVLDAGRELWVYDTLLTPLKEGPACWGTVSDENAGIYWLFLESVEGVPLCEVGDMGAWARAAGWLGRFHARFLGREPWNHRLLRQDARSHESWYSRALSRASDPEARTLRGIEPAWRAALGRVMESRSTLLHGEFYPSNILVAGPHPVCGIVPLDWECAGIGPAVLDLAALASGSWTDGERWELAHAYREARIAEGAPCPPLSRLLALLDAASLLVAVLWLGWTTVAWVPPEELRTNWLAETVRWAGKVGSP